jgi:NAD(P)H-dependent FMN reductase
MDTKKIQIIIGSTRPGRIGNQVAEWIKQEFNEPANIKIEIIDLLDINLPFMDELALPSSGQYTKDHTKTWSNKIKEGDGYIWLTPEYNAGYSASIKNAIDYLYQEWSDKPILIASYGVGGGSTANHNLTDVASRLKAKVIEPTIELTIHREMRDESGQLKDPVNDFKIYHEAVETSLQSLINLVNNAKLVSV